MFSNHYQSDNKRFCLIITIKTNGKKNFRVWAEDLGKKNSVYANREIEVDGRRSIYFSFPVSPKKLFIGALNVSDPKDNDFSVEMLETAIKDYNVWLDESTKSFLKCAISFSQMCGFTNASPKGRIFTNDDKQYNIKFFDIIRDYKSGNILNTPARIGHNTGIIEVAKAKFDKYTVPMRMMILLHEYSHKYRNPKIGLEISNEIGADINALYIYLGLGFSKIDAICVYANVFLRAQTQGNIARMRKIMDYINKFEQEDFAYRNA
jgi:hypothetical protein